MNAPWWWRTSKSIFLRSVPEKCIKMQVQTGFDPMETWLDHKSNQVHTPVWRFNLNSFFVLFFMSILTVTLVTPDVKWVRTELWIVFALGLMYVIVHQRGLIFWRRISWSKNAKMDLILLWRIIFIFVQLHFYKTISIVFLSWMFHI